MAKSRGLSTTRVRNAITNDIVWNHVRITLKAHMSLCYEVALSGGKPIENSCVAFCFVLHVFVGFLLVFLLLLLTLDQESE